MGRKKQVQTEDEDYPVMYRKGYLKAMLDIADFFDSYSEGLAVHRIYSKMRIQRLIKSILTNYRYFMMYGSNIDLIIYPDGKLEVLGEKKTDE